LHKTHLVFFSLALALLISPLAVAIGQKDVAYILEDSSTVSGNIILSFDQLGLTYDVIRDSQIHSTNFSNYHVLLIAENVGNKALLPYTQKHAIFLDKSIAEVVWSGTETGSTTNARQIKVAAFSHVIFSGISVPADGVIDIYGGTGSESHYLKAKPSYVTSLAIRTSENHPVIATSTRTINGYPVKDLFFGLPVSNAWNSNAQTIFQNSLTYLMADIDQDGDGYAFEVDCNDQNNQTYPGAPEIPYNHIDENCDGYDLLDVDADGFCAQGYIIQNPLLQCPFESGLMGTDCNDNNPIENPANLDKTLNCINDAPEFVYVPQGLVFSEGDVVEFEVTANDPEEDYLEFSINDSRFIVDENYFTWQTNYEDAGLHNFIITVTDGEFSINTTISIQIINVNSPPTSYEIPDVVWDEDTSTSIDLNSYFSDSDSDNLVFGIESYSAQNDIEVNLDSNGIVSFEPSPDFFGERTIIFYAEDSHSRILSNPVNLIVRNVNDPLLFNGTVPDVQFNEDTILENAFNLNDYFTDIDSNLEFAAIGNQNVSISIENGLVSFYPAADYSGIETVYFTVTDGEFSETSNGITITVYEQGEPPEFLPLNCALEIEEDASYTCYLEASDLENDFLTFSVTEQDNIVCEISGNLLTYHSKENYNGPASCLLEVSDIDGSAQALLSVTILPVNDAPEITSFTPEENVVRIVEGQSKSFSIIAQDVDSSISTEWYLASALVFNTTESSSSYILSNPSLGSYLVRALVKDEEYQTDKLWSIIVGPIGDFTCEEASGNICSDRKTCGTDFLGVKDTDVCCPTECIPSFDDADSCDAINNNVIIDIDDFEADLELGNNANIDFSVTNRLEDDQTFKIKAELYDLEKDRSIESVKTESEIGRGNSRSFYLDLAIPEDLDVENGNFVIFISANDDECGQNYKTIGIERPKKKISIADFNLPSTAVCGDIITADVKTENLGSEDQDIILTVKNSALKVDESEDLELKRYGDSDTEKTEFSWEIPLSIESGEYEITAAVSYSTNSRETLSKKISIECEKERLASSTLDPNTMNGKATLNQLQEPVEENKTSLLPAMVLGMLNILLIGAALILYLVYRRQ
jgi:hypothetical protein